MQFNFARFTRIYYIYDRNFALHYPKRFTIGVNTCLGDGQKVGNDG